MVERQRGRQDRSQATKSQATHDTSPYFPNADLMFPHHHHIIQGVRPSGVEAKIFLSERYFFRILAGRRERDWLNSLISKETDPVLTV